MDYYIAQAKRGHGVFVSIKQVVSKVRSTLSSYDNKYPYNWRLSDVFEFFEIDDYDFGLVISTYLAHVDYYKGKECYNSYLSMAADVFNECMRRGHKFQNLIYLNISHWGNTTQYTDLCAELKRAELLYKWTMLRRLQCTDKK
jgi:hypothetical protein